MTMLLEVSKLGKVFDGFRLGDVDFTLPRGYIMGLIGPNGAGKTTVIKLILNMLQREQGEIKIAGRDVLENEKAVKEGIGVVFDRHYFCEDWNLKDVERALAPFYVTWDAEKYHELTGNFSLPRKLSIKSYSRGMQVKLMLACALSHGAELLILDEPSSGLDPIARDELLTILADYVSDGKKSVLFSSHITSDLERIADYVTFLQKGEMVFSGGKDEFIDSFRRVTGGPKELSLEQKKKVLGYRETPLHFEGMIRSGDEALFSNVHTDLLRMEEIMVYSNGGGMLCE